MLKLGSSLNFFFSIKKKKIYKKIFFSVKLKLSPLWLDLNSLSYPQLKLDPGLLILSLTESAQLEFKLNYISRENLFQIVDILSAYL